MLPRRRHLELRDDGRQRREQRLEHGEAVGGERADAVGEDERRAAERRGKELNADVQ